MMRNVTAVLLLMSNFPCAFGVEKLLVLDQPTVVVVYTPESELKVGRTKEPGFVDFIDDFDWYRMQLVVKLRKQHVVKVIESAALQIRFSKSKVMPIFRDSLGGFGFVVYVPGKAPVVFSGVATHQDVICTVQKLSGKHIGDIQCPH